MNRFAKLSVVLLFALFTTIQSQLYSQLISSEFIEIVRSDDITSIPDIPSDYDVELYKLVYNTTNLHGDTVTASGLVTVPVNTTCESFPISVYCHGTVLRQNNVPSLGSGDEIPINFSSAGYITVAPDYLGLGESPGIHPYLHSETEATATINLIRATREFLKSVDAEDNGEVFVTGYSQGGHAAMATVEYAQNNDLLNELRIIAAAPCSGSFNITDYQVRPVIFQDVSYAFLGYGVYFILGYQEAYGDLYGNLSDIFQAQFIDDIELYFDGEQDQYSIGFVNSILPNRISQLMRDSFINVLQTNLNHPLWQAVAKNDNYDWKPEFPLRMFYCTGDNQVSFFNSTTTEATMKDNGAENVEAINSQSGASHGQCVVPALVDTYQFFDSLATKCTSVDITETHSLSASVYPNPTTDRITIKSTKSISNIKLYDTKGELIRSVDLSNTMNPTIKMDTLHDGVYIIRLTFTNGESSSIKVVKE